MDPVFEEEQAHLTATYARLQEQERLIADRLAANLAEVQAFKGGMSGELATNVDSDESSMETYAEYAVMNNVVDSFNISIDLDTESLQRVRILLQKPYFAKVSLQFPGKPAPRDVYLGAVGATDENHRTLVVDWRSPVAETYYSQQTGPVSYEANGRTVTADLKLRRQFDLERDELRSYFDTSVAIEDPLLLQSLSSRRSSQLQAITATIQREQNEVIRHADVPALLVRGIAGSGKTSVMLQRIAYLLFRERNNLTADQVYLITPNPVFGRYIKNVLPELGEKNPNVLLWDELMARLGPGDRNLGGSIDTATLGRIDAGVESLVLGPQDVREVRVGDHVLLTLDQVWKTVEKYQLRGVAAGPRLTALVEEDLVEKLERRISQLAGTDAIYTEMFALSDDEQERIFGYDVQLSNVADDELRDYSVTYLDDLCAPAFDAVHDAAWLRIDRIGMQMLGQKSITGSEWLFLKMALVGQRDDRTKFVMVDEVQDYTAAQLTVLARYFGRAHFLLLGDPNQAIRPDTASWDEIRAVFEAERGGVADCSLMTSYRSSPEITDLFASLLPAEERIQISSVMRPGEAPRRAAFASKDAYLDALVEAVRAGAACEGGLTALVCRDRGGAKRLEKLLAERMGAEAPVLLREKMSLPEAGVVLIDLPLAKGLEFDRVVVADASEDVYPTGDDLARRCLYTAISRATQQASLLAWGELTGLLG